MVDPFPDPATAAEYRAYMTALLAGDRRRCLAILSDRLDRGAAIRDLYEGLFRDSLYEVGDLWESNRISVAAEHMATAITEGLMNGLYDRIVSARRIQRKAVVASVAGELHQVGGKMVADVFEMRGWDSYYLGADIPAGELVRLVRDIRPDAAGLSMSLYFHLDSLKKTLRRLRDGFPDLAVIVGGQAFRHGGGGTVEKEPNVRYIDSLPALENFIGEFEKTAPKKGDVQ